MSTILEDPNLIDQKPIQIFGYIFDENRTPLEGVNIVDENEKKGTVSDASGRFSLDTMNKNNIIFSYLGKQTITGYGYHYRGKSIIMKEATEDLPAVIISGSTNVPPENEPSSNKNKLIKYAAAGITGLGLLYLFFKLITPTTPTGGLKGSTPACEKAGKTLAEKSSTKTQKKTASKKMNNCKLEVRKTAKKVTL